MKISDSSIEKVTAVVNGSTRILKTYYIGPVKNTLDNDFFNSDISKIISNDTILCENGLVKLENGEVSKVLFHDITVFGSLDFYEPFNHEEKDDERLFLASNIWCDDDEEVIIRLGKQGGRKSLIKLWINGTLIYNSSPLWQDTYVVFLRLNKGNNLIFAECSTRAIVSVKIDKLSSLLEGIQGDLIKDYIHNEVFNSVEVVGKEYDISNKTDYEFSVIPKDFVGIQGSKLKIELKDEENKTIYTCESSFYERIKINLLKFQKILKNNVFAVFNIQYENSACERYSVDNFVILNSDLLYSQIKIYKDQFQSVSSQCNLSDEYKVNIEGIINDLDYKNNPFEVDFFLTRTSYLKLLLNLKKALMSLFEYIRSGRDYNEYFKDTVYTCGTHYIYFRSKLDNSIQRYIISIPFNYNLDQRYPIVIYPNQHSEAHRINSKKLIELLSRDVIIATISCRGMTAGSYIGEAAFLECFSILKEKYNIDEDRVYLQGFCTTAYSVWALTQSYPHLFAAATCFEGGVDYKKLDNVKNVNIMYVCAQNKTPNSYSFEEYNAHSRVTNLLKDSACKYEGVLIGESFHMTALIHYNSGYSIDWMLQFRREKYPRTIFFKTERIRHNIAYWIDIISFDKEAYGCTVYGEIIDSNQINLRLTNVNKFVLTVPDYVDKNKLYININETSKFVVSNINNELAFEKQFDSYQLLSSINCFKGNQGSLGMGILDVYMDSLKIVVPSKFDISTEGDIINKVAKNFSKPVCMGVDNILYVNYPIITDDFFIQNQQDSCNLILIGSKNNYGLISRIKNELPISLSDNGFSYNGVFTEGDYCIFQILQSPFSSGKKVLIIFANNVKLLKSCLYARSVIMPSYLNGVHPHLNSEVLIFNGRNYFRIYTVGDSITKV